MSIKRHVIAIVILIVGVIISLISLSLPVDANTLPQQPTASMPTVTGTVSGPIVTVKSSGQESSVNLRSGPGVFYPKIGIMEIGQRAPAKGRSAGGDWILVEYFGVPGNEAWVYSPFVDITPGSLSIIEPPPTPTPMQTSTIDPTLAAQFIVTAVPTRLPSYTPPAPLSIPTFTAEGSSNGPGNIPMGLVIFVLAAIGILTGLFSLAQRR
jgi:hypothetical protein